MTSMIDIAKYRKDRGITQRALALKAGISPAALSKLESDDRDPLLSTAIALAEQLRIPLLEFATGVTAVAPRDSVPNEAAMDALAVMELLLENPHLLSAEREKCAGIMGWRSYVLEELTPRLAKVYDAIEYEDPFDWEFAPVAVKLIDLMPNIPDQQLGELMAQHARAVTANPKITLTEDEVVADLLDTIPEVANHSDERTDRQIVDQTNAVARHMYSVMGYTVPDDHKFYEAERTNYHPHEAQCWDAACEAQRIITMTDPDDAVSNLED